MSSQQARLIWLLCYAALVLGLILGSYPLVFSIDTISYFRVAEHYANGDWATAINGYWSPLFSWLMLPGMLLGLSTPVAAQLVSILAGWAFLEMLWRLSGRLGLRSRWRLGLQLALLPFLIGFGLLEFMADVPAAACLLLFFDLITRPAVRSSFRAAFLVGLVGGLAYLAKYFNGPFIIGFLLLWLGGQALRSRGAEARQWARALGGSLAGVLLLLLPWASILSMQYGKPTLSTSGGYNLRLQPLYGGEQAGNRLGLLPPIGKRRSSWEDITLYDDGPLSFRELPSRELARRFLWHFRVNAGVFLRKGFCSGGLILLVLIDAALLFWQRPPPGWVLAGLLASMIYLAGYFLAILELRYVLAVLVWLAVALLAVLPLQKPGGQALALLGLGWLAVGGMLYDLGEARQDREIRQAWETLPPDPSGLTHARQAIWRHKPEAWNARHPADYRSERMAVDIIAAANTAYARKHAHFGLVKQGSPEAKAAELCAHGIDLCYAAQPVPILEARGARRLTRPSDTPDHLTIIAYDLREMDCR